VIFLPNEGETSCLDQALRAFADNEGKKSMLGVVSVPESNVSLYGTLTGDFIPGQSVVDVTKIVEKPTIEEARKSLVPPEGATEAGSHLIVLGPYVLTPHTMNILKHNVENDVRSGGEVQMTTAIAQLMEDEGLLAVPLRGTALDIGVPEEFGRSNAILAQRAFGK